MFMKSRFFAISGKVKKSKLWFYWSKFKKIWTKRNLKIRSFILSKRISGISYLTHFPRFQREHSPSCDVSSGTYIIISVTLGGGSGCFVFQKNFLWWMDEWCRACIRDPISSWSLLPSGSRSHCCIHPPIVEILNRCWNHWLSLISSILRGRHLRVMPNCYGSN